jgi:hypothetical protein
MKIPWPESWKLLDKILATFAAFWVIVAYVAGFIIALWVWLGE